MGIAVGRWESRWAIDAGKEEDMNAPVRYGLLGAPAAVGVATMAGTVAQCCQGGAAVNPWLLLGTLAAGALFVATGGKKKKGGKK
jgi:hypothetical protein